jgi:hypothetical protein
MRRGCPLKAPTDPRLGAPFPVQRVENVHGKEKLRLEKEIRELEEEASDESATLEAEMTKKAAELEKKAQAKLDVSRQVCAPESLRFPESSRAERDDALAHPADTNLASALALLSSWRLSKT